MSNLSRQTKVQRPSGEGGINARAKSSARRLWPILAACLGLAVASGAAFPSGAVAVVEVYSEAGHDDTVYVGEIFGHQYVISIETGSGVCYFTHVGDTSA